MATRTIETKLVGADETRADLAALKGDAQELEALVQHLNYELAQLDQNLGKLRKVLGGQTSVSDAPQ